MTTRSVVRLEEIQQAILLIRGQKVMLDRDWAALYGLETRVLNQAVRRHPDRFPADFMIELTRQEIVGISQSVTSSNLKYSKRVTAFTQEGVAMLSSVLNSPRAIQVNVAIMRVFARLRESLAAHKDLAAKLAQLERKIEGHDGHIRSLFEAIRQLMASPSADHKQIGFHVRERVAPYRRR